MMSRSEEELCVNGSIVDYTVGNNVIVMIPLSIIIIIAHVNVGYQSWAFVDSYSIFIPLPTILSVIVNRLARVSLWFCN